MKDNSQWNIFMLQSEKFITIQHVQKMQNTGQYVKTKLTRNADTYNTTAISFRQRGALLVNTL